MCFNCAGNSQPTITSTGTGIPNDKGWWEQYLKQTITGDTVNDKNWWESYLKQTTASSDKQIVGGSDYLNSSTHTWENVPHTLTNIQKDLDEIKYNTLKGE